MATKIVTKNSSTASAVPTTSDLVQGELAVNVADKKLFTEDNFGAIIELADGVKLAGIEAGADVTDTANVTAAGALMDSELTSEASVKALNQGVATTDSPTFAGIALPDSQKATFGAGDDLQIYHDGSDSYVKDAGAGYLNLLGTGRVVVGHPSNGDVYLNANYGGDVELFFSNSKKFETTSTGIDVTGTATMDSLVVDTDTLAVDSTNNRVGIGTSSPSAPLHVKSSGELARLETTSSGGNNYLAFYKPSDARKGFIGYGGGASDNQLYINNDENADIVFRPNNSEAMRIDSSGRLIIASAGGADTGYIRVPVAGSTLGAWTSYAGTASTRIHMRFQSSSGLAGYISTTGLTAFYGTSSDYRLKTDAQPMTGATARLKALKPVNFEWIADGTRVDGFLAHEAQAVVPECVTGEKDAMMEEEYEVSPEVLDEEGNTVEEAVMGTRSVPEYQGIDQSKLVPLLVATIQELEARIAALENN